LRRDHFEAAGGGREDKGKDGRGKKRTEGTGENTLPLPPNKFVATALAATLDTVLLSSESAGRP